MDVRILFQQRIGGQALFIALGLFFPDVQKAHPGLGDPQLEFRINGPHDGVLDQLFRFGIHLGAGIHQYRGPLHIGDHRGNGRPFDAPDPSQAEQGGSHCGTGTAGGHQGVTFLFVEEMGSHHNGGIPFLLYADSRMVLHFDDLAGMMDGYPGIVFLMFPGQFLADHFLIPHQHHVAAIFVNRLKHPFDDLGRAIVSAHYVNCDFHLLGSFVPEWRQSGTWHGTLPCGCY